MAEVMEQPIIDTRPEETSRGRVLESLERVDLKGLYASVIDRLVLLEEETYFNQHSRMIASGLENLFKHLAAKDSSRFNVSNEQIPKQWPGKWGKKD